MIYDLERTGRIEVAYIFTSFVRRSYVTLLKMFWLL